MGYVSGGVQVAAVPAGDGREVLVDDVPVDLRGVAERSGDAPGVGVEEELGGVVPQAGGRVPAAVHAQPVALPGRHVRHVALPHAVAPAVQRVAPLGEAGGGGGVLVEQAQVDRGGVGGDHGDVDPAVPQVRPEPEGTPVDPLRRLTEAGRRTKG